MPICHFESANVVVRFAKPVLNAKRKTHFINSIYTVSKEKKVTLIFYNNVYT